MKVLFLFWHGLGDNILATPAIRKYRELHPDHHIGWAMLERFKSAQLWNPNIDEYFWTSDAWNEHGSYEAGRKAVIAEALQIQEDNGYHKLVVIDHKSSGDHKIHRTANEMGIYLNEKELKTDFYFQYFPTRHWDTYDFFHGKTGVDAKDMKMEQVGGNIANATMDADVNKPIWYWAEWLDSARNIYVVDSVYFHVACALGRKPDMAYFAKGPSIFNVVKPLHMDVSDIVKYEL